MWFIYIRDFKCPFPNSLINNITIVSQLLVSVVLKVNVTTLTATLNLIITFIKLVFLSPYTGNWFHFTLNIQEEKETWCI